MKIKKGERVKIITGKDKNKEGRILKVWPKQGKVMVEGLNLVTRHRRPRQQGKKGQRVQVPAPLDISNVILICPKCTKPTRIGFKILKDKRKVRMCKKCKEIIE